MSTQDRERRIYEANVLIRYLDRRQPGAFRLIWETYLLMRRLRYNAGPLPLHPTTPILQVQGWPQTKKRFTPVSEPHMRILIFSFTGWSTHMIFDGLLGTALQLRGARVHHFICGGILPICHIHNASSDVPPMPCGRCRAYADSALQAFGFTPDRLSQYVSEQERQQIEAEIDAVPDEALLSYEHEGLPYGHFASISVRWFFAWNHVEPDMLPHFRKYLVLGREVGLAAERLIERTRPDRIVMVNGLLTPEQVVRAIATRRGIPYLTTERGYLANTFLLAHNRASGLFTFQDTWEAFRDQPLSEAAREELLTYLHQRRYGHRQMDNLWQGVRDSVDTLRDELGLSPERPVVAAFTNVTGDTALIGRDLAYSDITEWIDHLIACFTERPQVDLVFRIHPAESRLERYQPRQSLGTYIAQKYPSLPPNIKIIPSESTLSSYTLAEISDLVMVYASTMGLETVMMGKPTSVAADVHYREKGFTLDLHKPEDMVNVLERWQVGRLPPIDMEIALRYAYTFLFRVMVPFDDVMEESTFGQMRLKIKDPDDLQPGKITPIDALCDAVLRGELFVNPYARG